MKKCLTAILSICLILSLLTGCSKKVVLNHNAEPANEEQSEDLSTDDPEKEGSSADADSPADTDSSADEENKSEVFREYLDEELIPKYGLFKSPQEGTVRSDVYRTNDEGRWVYTEWLNPNGILNASIYDFDMDGDEEMLLIISSDGDDFGTPSDDGSGTIYLVIYENDNGKIRLADSVLFGVDENCFGDVYDWNMSRITLPRDDWYVFFYDVSVAKVDGQVYLLCENNSCTGPFADGSFMSYWALTYRDNSLEYAYIYTQNGWGSSGFEFLGFEYSNGKCVSSETCYNEDEYGLEVDKAYVGMDFSESVAAFFKKQGVVTDRNIEPYGPNYTSKSIFSNNADVSLLFELRNEWISQDYDTGIHKFRMTNHSYGNSVDEGQKKGNDSEEKNAGRDNADIAANFEEFLSGSASVKIADDCYDYNSLGKLNGKTFTLSELKAQIPDGGGELTVSYAPLHFHDKNLYALKMGYMDTGADYSTYFILADHYGALEIVFMASSGMRTWIVINENGIANIDGGGDMGEYLYGTYVPDQNFTYKELNACTQRFGESIREYCMDDTSNLDVTYKIIIEAGSGNEDAWPVILYKEEINGKRYDYFGGDEGVQGLTQDTVDYIDSVAAKYGFKFDGKAVADEAREAYEKELDVYKECQDTKEVEWKKLT